VSEFAILMTAASPIHLPDVNRINGNKKRFISSATSFIPAVIHEPDSLGDVSHRSIERPDGD
jgi:hypothetical protein